MGITGYLFDASELLLTRKINPPYMKTSNIRFLLLIGLLASVLVGIGEYLLHYLPGGPEGESSCRPQGLSEVKIPKSGAASKHPICPWLN